ACLGVERDDTIQWRSSRRDPQSDRDANKRRRDTHALGLTELKVLVKRAFDRGFIDRQWLGFEDFQHDIEWAARHPDTARYPQSDEFTLFGDTVEELSRWYGFSDEARADRERLLQEIEAEVAATEPYHNPFRGVGRNDPCPCGSGKKFKRYCLGLSAALT